MTQPEVSIEDVSLATFMAAILKADYFQYSASEPSPSSASGVTSSS
jgi:hypothetical protein